MKILVLIFILLLGRCNPPAPVAEIVPVNERVLIIAKSFDGHIEDTPNRSVLIDYWMQRLHAPPGENWCAAFASFVLDSAQVQSPAIRSARALDFITNQSVRASRVSRGRAIEKGSLVIWRNGFSNSGHVGFVLEDWQGSEGMTIEGNVSNGVRVMKRNINPTAYHRIRYFTELK